jgi:hypothetical protein
MRIIRVTSPSRMCVKYADSASMSVSAEHAPTTRGFRAERVDGEDLGQKGDSFDEVGICCHSKRSDSSEDLFWLHVSSP